MALITAQVINVNGLNAKDLAESKSSNWKDLTGWMDEQERYFSKRRIESDAERIDHVILNLDVRHWNKLENFYKYNQRDEITYEMMKRVLCKKVKKVIDPTMAKYDEKVDGFVDKLNIMNLNFNTMQAWLKKMRSLCDGQGKEDYLTRKILARVMDSQKETVYRSLLQEIKAYVELYGERLGVSGQNVGKGKKKELAKLAIIKDTLITALSDL